jgi:hypothetical protein
MLPGGKTDPFVSDGLQGRPFAERRRFSIRADHPFGTYRLTLAEHLTLAIEGGAATPQKRNAELGGPLGELGMQRYSPEAEANALAELSFDTRKAIGVLKANTAERNCLTITESDA